MLTEEEKIQREYYNNISLVYDNHYSDQHALNYRYHIYDEFLNNVPLSGMNALDAMCGGGQNTGYLLSRGCKVSAFDLSEEQCKVFHNRYPLNEVRCESVFNTTFPSNYFDFIATNSLHHIQPRVGDAVEELLRILRPGGYLLIWEPNANSFMDVLRKIWYKLDQKYFKSNEASIDIREIINWYGDRIIPVKIKYGGSIEYLLVYGSMIFRISPKVIPYYQKTAHKLEKAIEKLGPFCSCWVLGLIQKNRNRLKSMFARVLQQAVNERDQALSERKRTSKKPWTPKTAQSPK